ncbi:outer membrane protein OmpA-like peptidoglycan-associated protein [Litoreibacter halocynthiae]|uniref:Outer membrane protein OmpA-like peptidoglycan-associated protein n=1 Tax=Litoreibacter halocynthiae TaxID=1242689 RepID=A0A4R7LEA2_9RHOB|nr:OmpA family protein [Litoreibacter halocynthiae]TDT73948.1 outer membrane protein OmpA-like peptidoglycan-associated protein [Litoreibacter halocynthiae]
MGLFSTINAAKYRAEGLNLMQAFRLETNLSKLDFKSTEVVAALAFMLVGSLSFIAMQSVGGASARSEQVTAVQAEPAAILDQPRIEDTTPEPLADAPASQNASVIQASLTLPAPVEPVVAPAPAIVEAATLEVVAPAPAPQVASTAPEAPDCLVELRQIADNATFYFGVGSAQLNGTDLVRLSQLGRMANACPEAKIQITGHSDTTGSDLINFDLSWKRADSTMNALTQLGLDTSQFEPVGFGARMPLSQGDASDDDRNRRVEFVILRNDPDS